MAVDQTRQGHMPLPDDRMADRSETLAYVEAVRFTNPIEQEFRGKVDDKYQFSCNSEDIKVHGWMSTNPSVGFWQITPSHEYRSGGPLKQQLTSHVGPTSLSVFISGHYMGDRTPQFRNGEPWKKVFGPVFIYLNSGSTGTNTSALWSDANIQMKKEMQSWPYSFPVSDDFPKSKQRGSVYGRLLVRDRYINILDFLPGGSAYVGLAPPGEVGSWQTEGKGYQFWTLSSTNGVFAINNIRPGIYNLYASVPGFIGEYKSDKIITIRPGENTDLRDVIYFPPRNGPTLWEIGYPDRSAAEFFIPDPDSQYLNPILTYHDRFRQYGLWDMYSNIYPNEDLVYTIHTSDYRKDWFFAHATRKTKQNFYEATTWQIKFNLSNVGQSTTYKLRLALAAASQAELLVRFNSLNIHHPHFRTGMTGRDNAIARHGIHGIYWLFNVDAKSEWLVEGENTIYLTQATPGSPFAGLMYDYIRFEGPSNGS
ncbi:hypothetical protein AQUCO_02300190v1 [Aquilegia coerulea]|uniref:rhamnogalacturonan endolyase n=2 Tax=Aquilegia coerulea TaxID=218851 RepID=A0A2G5DCK6_AQUCA|nr:hypothetical protein AQUCO_02300190v1 [Aquilegia coerulea]